MRCESSGPTDGAGGADGGGWGLADGVGPDSEGKKRKV
jgi:hypothetical protein